MKKLTIAMAIMMASFGAFACAIDDPMGCVENQNREWEQQQQEYRLQQLEQQQAQMEYDMRQREYQQQQQQQQYEQQQSDPFGPRKKCRKSPGGSMLICD